MAKSKLPAMNGSKLVSVKLAASTSTKKPGRIGEKNNNYSKSRKQPELISNANFGQTGLTGES